MSVRGSNSILSSWVYVIEWSTILRSTFTNDTCCLQIQSQDLREGIAIGTLQRRQCSAMLSPAECQSAQMSKIANDGLTRSGRGCFTAVGYPYGNSRQQWVNLKSGTTQGAATRSNVDVLHNTFSKSLSCWLDRQAWSLTRNNLRQTQ